MDVGPKRDLLGMYIMSNLSVSSITFYFLSLGDLAGAIRNRTDLVFGIYHCMYEWFNPLYVQDKQNNFQTQTFPTVCLISIEQTEMRTIRFLGENNARTKTTC